MLFSVSMSDLQKNYSLSYYARNRGYKHIQLLKRYYCLSLSASQGLFLRLKLQLFIIN